MEDLCIFERNKSPPEESNIKLFGHHHHLAAEQVATNFHQAQQSAANESVASGSDYFLHPSGASACRTSSLSSVPLA